MENTARRKNQINDIRHLVRVNKELNYTAIKNIINLFRQERETKAIKDRIFRDIKNHLSMKKKMVIDQ